MSTSPTGSIEVRPSSASFSVTKTSSSCEPALELLWLSERRDDRALLVLDRRRCDDFRRLRRGCSSDRALDSAPVSHETHPTTDVDGVLSCVLPCPSVDWLACLSRPFPPGVPGVLSEPRLGRCVSGLMSPIERAGG